MKANELMIGDFLKWKEEEGFNDEDRKAVLRVTKVCTGEIWIDGRCGPYVESLFEPIPLTPEILEKNGFAKLEDESGKQRYRWEYADGIHISIDFTDTDPWVHVSNRCYFAVPYCEYVHQLQHALRLCGMSKEIEL